MDKKAFEFSFSWIFAIIIGATILFLAVYISIKIINSGAYSTNTEVAVQLSVLTEPMETGPAEGKIVPIEFSSDTRVYFYCSEDNPLGQSKLSVSKKKFSKQWGDPGANITVKNKYLFADRMLEGKKLNVFSKSIKMPYKVADAIIVYTANYCFDKSSTPAFIKSGIPSLGSSECKPDAIDVCFSTQSSFKQGCDVKVRGCKQGSDPGCFYDYYYGKVDRGSFELNYFSDMIYPAIFSDKDIYNCNFRRIMERAIKQSLMYRDESIFLSDKCGTVNPSSLAIFSNTLSGPQPTQAYITSIVQSINSVDCENYIAECSLWRGGCFR